jgi:hypothetical protein
LLVEDSRRRANAANVSESPLPPGKSTRTRRDVPSDFGAVASSSVERPACARFDEAAPLALGPAFDGAEDVVFPEFPVPVSASATAGRARMNPPTPSATANAPTLPMC